MSDADTEVDCSFILHLLRQTGYGTYRINGNWKLGWRIRGVPVLPQTNWETLPYGSRKPTILYRMIPRLATEVLKNASTMHFGA